MLLAPLSHIQQASCFGFGIKLMMKSIPALLCLFFSMALEAQQDTPASLQLGVHYKYGALITHRPSIADEIRGKYPRALELQFLKRYSGNKPWHHHWEPASFGFSFSLYDLDQSEILGRAYALKLFFARDYLPAQKRQRLLFSLGTGLCLTPTVFDENENPLNSLISSKLNLLLSIALDYELALGKDMSLLVGIGIDHFSNAATKFPNTGINIPHAKAGLSYTLQKKAVSGGDMLNTPFDKSGYFFPILTLARKSAGRQFDDNDWAYSLILQYVRRYSPRHAMIVSMDYMYNNTIRKIRNDPQAVQSRIGLAAGWQLEFGRTAFFMQLGYYLYRPVDVDESLYHRIGLKQQIYRNLYLTSFLKSHYFRADVWEWGLALKI